VSVTNWFSMLFLLSLSGCAAGAVEDAPSDDPTASQEGAWDSQKGNPTHATHSYLVEYSIDALRWYAPELETYRAQIVAGANTEVHDLVLTDKTLESLRAELQGTNGACQRPDLVWAHARERYSHGDKSNAYWYVGLLLHYVGDMGVPAHAFGVYHQAGLTTSDHFEMLGLAKWAPSFSAINRTDPAYADPSRYVAFSGWWAASDFTTAWPETRYTRTFFSMSWLWASSKEKSFVRDRQGRSAEVTRWAMWSAVTHLH